MWTGAWRLPALPGLLLLCLLLLCLLLLCLRPAPAHAAEDFRIEASAQNGAVVLHVQARLHARMGAIWSTLTDYEKLPQFVPCIRVSRVLERRGPLAVVEQKGAAQVLFFSYPIEVTVESVEKLHESISVRVLKGNLRQLEGGYKLTRVDGREDEYILTWRGIIEPDFDVPSLISVPLMRASLKDQFLAMIAEIERREAALEAARPATAEAKTAAGG